MEQVTFNQLQKELPGIEVFVTRHKGNTVKYERDNEGLRDKLEKPYTPEFKHAKFTLPNGKKKCERFTITTFDTTILEAIRKKYSNYSNYVFFIKYNSR